MPPVLRALRDNSTLLLVLACALLVVCSRAPTKHQVERINDNLVELLAE